MKCATLVISEIIIFEGVSQIFRGAKPPGLPPSPT